MSRTKNSFPAETDTISSVNNTPTKGGNANNNSNSPTKVVDPVESDESLRGMWNCVRENNGIKALLSLLRYACNIVVLFLYLAEHARQQRMQT